MHRYFFNPFSILILIFLILALILLLPLIFLGVIGSALSRLGFGPAGVILILFGLIIGSFINIPVAKIKSNPTAFKVPHGLLMNRYYRVSDFSTETVVAVNFGGAVIPVLISIILLFRMMSMGYDSGLYISVLVAVLLVAFVTNRFAGPVQGVGIVTPFFVPPLCALLCGIVFGWGDSLAAPVIAYIGGTMGTLAGADLLNLKRLGEIGAPVASIGGAGTFDGVFLTGIIAALLA
jgi:uncharacterized membrane protein